MGRINYTSIQGEMRQPHGEWAEAQIICHTLFIQIWEYLKVGNRNIGEIDPVASYFQK